MREVVTWLNKAQANEELVNKWDKVLGSCRACELSQLEEASKLMLHIVQELL